MTATLKIKDDRYYAVINYKDGKSYKQKWISLGMSAKNNKRKAEARLEEIKREYESVDLRSGGETLFVEYVKQWLHDKKDTVELSTWEGYQIYAERHIIPYFEPKHLSLKEIKPRHIQEYYQYKLKRGRMDGKSGGLSIPSIKKHSIVIHEVLNDAVLNDLIQRNPAIGVKLPAKDTAQKEYVFLTSGEANALLKAFEGHRLQTLVYVTLYYGLRRSEVLGLRWSAVDFDRDTIAINHTVVKNKTIVAKDKTKTQSSFHVYALIPDVKNALLAERARQKKNCKELGRHFKETDYIFTWDDGTLFRPDYITRGFQRVVNNAGLQKMRFHDLRHSTASVLHDKGWDIQDIKSWLRHSSIKVTSDIYTHITEDRKSKMAIELDSTFSIKSN